MSPGPSWTRFSLAVLTAVLILLTGLVAQAGHECPSATGPRPASREGGGSESLAGCAGGVDGDTREQGGAEGGGEGGERDGGGAARADTDLYTLEHADPTGDVESFFGELPPRVRERAKDVDLVRLSSSLAREEGPGGGMLAPDPVRGLRISLRLGVDGTVRDSNSISYSLSVTADDESFLFIYSNGTCFEVFNNRPCPGVSGAGTDTLVLNVTEDDLGNPKEDFSVSATAYLFEDSSDPLNGTYTDSAPDSGGGGGQGKLVVQSPTPGSTVSGETRVAGTAGGREMGITTVEYQVDSTADSGWTEARTADGWDSFHFVWDAGGETDSEHVVYVRARNTTDEFLTEVSYWVDRDLATNPPTMDHPLPLPGDRHVRETLSSMTLLGFDISINLGEDIRLTRILPGHNVSGRDAEALEYVSEGSGTTRVMGVSLDMTVESVRTYTQEGLGLIRDDSWTNMSSALTGEVSAHTVTVFDPPYAVHGFPMCVGDSWTVTSAYTSTTLTYDAGGKVSEDVIEGNVTSDVEVLRVERVSVPAGTFDCFVLRVETTDPESPDSQMMDHTVEWYNRTASTAVLERTYDEEGNVISAMELKGFTRGEGSPDGYAPGDDGEDSGAGWTEDALSGGGAQLALLFVALAALLAFAAVHAARRRRAGRVPADSLSGNSDETGGGAGAGGEGNGEWLSCPNCGEDFEESKALVFGGRKVHGKGAGAGGSGPKGGGRAGARGGEDADGVVLIRCPHCGTEGRAG